MSGLRIRKEELVDDAMVVVRGGEFSAEALRFDVTEAFRRFGEYGLSVFAVEDEATLDELARGQLRRFEVLTLATAGAIRSAGLELRPTFRRPHYTIMLPELDADIARLVRCETARQRNRHFRPPGQRT